MEAKYVRRRRVALGRVIFLLEERSMQAFLKVLLPRLFPDLSFHCIPHEGKSDLERSISNTLRQWQEPAATFVVVRDNDGGDCFELKKRLRQLCLLGGAQIPSYELFAKNWKLGTLVNQTPWLTPLVMSDFEILAGEHLTEILKRVPNPLMMSKG